MNNANKNSLKGPVPFFRGLYPCEGSMEGFCGQGEIFYPGRVNLMCLGWVAQWGWPTPPVKKGPLGSGKGSD